MHAHDHPILEYARPPAPQGNLIRLVTALACAGFWNLLTLAVSAGMRDTGVMLNISLAASLLFWAACAIYLVLIRCRPSANSAFLIAYGFIPWVALFQFAGEMLHVQMRWFLSLAW